MNRLTTLLCCALLFSSCSLDEYLLAPNQRDHYDLPTNLIRESERSIVTFSSGENTLYGVHVTPRNTWPVGTYTILYCHGRDLDIQTAWPQVEQLYSAGYDVFIFDYRGYGMSSGKPSLDGFYADGRAALDYMLRELEINSADIVFYGMSLGSIVADYLAADVMSPHAIILESSFSTSDNWGTHLLPLNIPPSFVLEEHYDNLQFVRRLEAPLMLLHGGQDEILPYEDHGLIVYNTATVPKRLYFVPLGRHDTIPWVMGDAYLAEVRRFIGSARLDGFEDGIVVHEP